MATLRTLPKGIGTKAEVDQANDYMRDQPWYQADLAAFHQDPNHVNLSDAQAKQLLADERAHGVGISDHWKIDSSGNIHDASMGLGKKIAIGAGIGGLALTGLGAAGIGPLSGILGGAGAASGAAGAGAAAAGAGGTLGSTALGTGMMAALPGLASGTSAAGLGLGGALAGGAGLLGSTALGSGMAGLPAGLASGTSAAGTAGGGSGVGIGSTIKNFLLGGEGHKGLDPTTLLLGGLSMLQGNGQPDPYSGSTTNPEASLGNAIGRTNGLLDALQKRGPAHLRMPAPINIPGLGFQIGGGLGTDPSGQGGSFKLPSVYDQPDQGGPTGNPFSTAQFGSSPLLKGWADRLTRGK